MKLLTILCYSVLLISSGLQLAAKDLVRSCPPFCPPLQSCINVEKKLEVIKTSIQDCFDNLDAQCQVVCDKLESATSMQCSDTTPISAPVTITEPGSYCLIADITGTITIAADYVTLDLNDHVVSGGVDNIVILNQQNIVVKNGILRNATFGLRIDNAATVSVKNISFENNGTGYDLQNSTGFELHNCSFVGHTFRCMSIADSYGGTISWCNLHDNNLTGNMPLLVRCENVQVVTFSDVFAHNNSLGNPNGRVFLVGANSSNVIFNRCTANTITGTSDYVAFYLEDSTDCYYFDCSVFNLPFSQGFSSSSFSSFAGQKIVYDSCRSSEAAFGFLVLVSSNVCLLNCLAKNNATTGYLIASSANNYFKNNIAISNVVFGFNWDGNNDNVFFGNYAEANGTNYTGLPAPIITTYSIAGGTFAPARPSVWRNISAV